MIPKPKMLARDENGTVWLIGEYRYPKRSVWAGRRQFFKLAAYDSMEHAREIHPRLNVHEMPLFDLH
tara:strand:+ start:780 stop:980 length:201 start_codon:yes stop_codon:yes gene_type:complete